MKQARMSVNLVVVLASFSICSEALAKHASHSGIRVAVHAVGQVNPGSTQLSIEDLEEKTRALATGAELKAQQLARRLRHAKELLGKHYQKSIVKHSEGISDMEEFVLQ